MNGGTHLVIPHSSRKASGTGFLLSLDQQDKIDIQLATLLQCRSGARDGEDGAFVVTLFVELFGVESIF